MRAEHSVLNLRAGEWVEVRTREEILATLDERGRLDHLPFMPEMLQYCGQRLRVAKRADKTCDPAHAPWTMRRMTNSVHLEGKRCDGGAHGGCQAGCLIFWKEAWLKRVPQDVVPSAALSPNVPYQGDRGARAETSIVAATQQQNTEGETVYSCQATELRSFTHEMTWWDPRQYIRDWRSGNLQSSLPHDSRSGRLLEFMLAVTQVLRAFIISFFTEYRRVIYPSIVGTLKTTPVEILELRPGELVSVRSKEQIIATLDTQRCNRGLLFDGEMLQYCGGSYRVLGRVHKIIDEKTGKMMNMKYPCIILDGVACRSDYHRLCPRSIHHYWRESWLTRVGGPPLSSSEQTSAGTVDERIRPAFVK